eukprot:6865854-Pyramimonas_sp.AAC.1
MIGTGPGRLPWPLQPGTSKLHDLTMDTRLLIRKETLSPRRSHRTCFTDILACLGPLHATAHPGPMSSRQASGLALSLSVLDR